MTTTSPASSSSSQSKKHKTEHDDFETVKRYLLDCPHVPNDHPAVRAAVEGLEKEQKRRERDLKLQAKFTNKNTTAATTTTPAPALASSLTDSDVVVVNQETTNQYQHQYQHQHQHHPPPSTTNTDDSEMMEWQDVEAKKEQQQEDPSSFLGKQLSQLAIQDMAQHNAKVSSPLAAIAVVLHACLRSELLGFACTGIPEAQASIGFALPIRELPQHTFLPPQWENDSDTTTSPNKTISLRYRKPTMGALVLSVTLDEDTDMDRNSNSIRNSNRNGNVSIQMIRNQEPHSESLQFPMEDHINLDSWNAAKKTAGGGATTRISPSLHYKALHQLVTNVLRTFDLGAIDSEPLGLEASAVAAAAAAAPYVDTTVLHSKTKSETPTHTPVMVLPTAPSSEHKYAPKPIPKPWQQGVPATIDQAFGRRPFPDAHGDFADDLTPAGLRDPLRIGPGRMGGNLMGPTHPMFTGGPPGAPHMGGPGSMQPRFDPILPPGVDPGDLDPDTDPDARTRQQQLQQQRLRARRQPGEPNPDHLQPPNGFGGGDMFY